MRQLSQESIQNDKKEGDSEVEFVQGKTEELPFEDNSFDGACSLFSFRDWYDKRAGLGEVIRVLKPGAKVVIVDPMKINRIHGVLGWLWMRVWVGAYARIICGVKDHPWKWLTKTYVTFGTTRDYVRMMEDVGFENVSAKVVFPGMATIWEGTNPNHRVPILEVQQYVGWVSQKNYLFKRFQSMADSCN